MTNPYDFFEYKACINLPESKDRWKACQHQFKLMNITKVEQIFAVPPPADLQVSSFTFPRGNVGANLSHAKAIIHALNQNANSALIFEDDFYVTPNHAKILQLAINDLPANWDILYLGGNPTGPMLSYSPNLYKPTSMLGAFSYTISRQFMISALDMLMDNIATKPFDALLKSSSSQYNTFSTIVPVCRTRPGPSIVRDNQHRSYEAAITKNWESHKPK